MVTCPAGKQSISWLPKTNPASGVDFEARFSGQDCTPCSSRSQCSRSNREPRIIGLQTRDLHDPLQTTRTRQPTEGFPKSYAPRAGIESTHAQAIRRSGLRRTLSRTCQNALATCHHSGRNQPVQNRILGKRNAACPNALLSVRGSPIPCRVNSPPMSMLGIPRPSGANFPGGWKAWLDRFRRLRAYNLIVGATRALAAGG